MALHVHLAYETNSTYLFTWFIDINSITRSMSLDHSESSLCFIRFNLHRIQFNLSGTNLPTTTTCTSCQTQTYPNSQKHLPCNPKKHIMAIHIGNKIKLPLSFTKISSKISIQIHIYTVSNKFKKLKIRTKIFLQS